jgi:AsmA protein
MKKILKISGAALILILVLLIATPFIFKDKITREVKQFANRSLKSEFNFRDVSLSFFSRFPNLTLTVSGFSLLGSPPFEHDTLIVAREIGFGINLKSLFTDNIRINKVYLENAAIRILYNEKGLSNFDIYQTEDSTQTKPSDTAGGAQIHIEDITFNNCRFTYSDASIPFEVVANGLNYSGKSIYSGNIFDLSSKVKIDSLDVLYDNQLFISQKPVTAQMSTRINSDDLSIFFEKNDLKIKDIPLQFNGKFNFEKDGYSLSLTCLSVMEKEFLSARFKLVQGRNLYLSARATASVDLERWTKSLDYQTADLKGMFDLSLDAGGYYETGPVTKGGLRKEVDTVILSIPKFELMTSLSNGYLKYKTLPQALTGISFNLNAVCPDNNYNNISINLEKLKAGFLGNLIEGNFSLKGLKDMPVEANLQARCDLSQLKDVVPMDSLELSGLLEFKVNASGNYAPEKGKFPVTVANVSWENGRIRTSYYPNPIDKISMKMEVTTKTGTLADLGIKVNPFNFTFEGKPFTLTASLFDFNDLQYNVQSRGVIDLGKVYKVFSQKGMELDGYIETDLYLSGRQSDAMAQRIERLRNKGTLKLRNIELRAEDYPKPFIIKTGDFRFDQDKVWFDNFLAVYGTSDFMLKGSVRNSIAWMLAQGKTLKGDFHLTSKRISVDEFMVFAPPGNQPVTKNQSSGVVIIPRDFDIDFDAVVDQVAFSGLDIRNLKGKIDLKEGILVLSEAGFNLIGCQVGMSATYGSITPQKAHFEFQVKAEDFDVKRAYNEIAMVRDMASSAGNAEGLVSLDYSLKGKLNGDMYPILPSVEGGGVLSVRKIKVKGLKLFNDISKSTAKEGIANPDLSKVDIKSTIKNSTVTFEQFKFKVSGIRFRISGSSTFDNVVNMRIRLGLPPLGIFGIPLKVTGPMDNLKIKYGKGKDPENLQDSDYSDELPAEVLERIKKAKDDGEGDEGDK